MTEEIDEYEYPDPPTTSAGEYAGMAAGGIGCLAFGALGIAQIGAGLTGLSTAWGPAWATAACVLLFMTRGGIGAAPMLYGSYFCAAYIWGWGPFWGVIFAAPGLLFMVPAIIAGLIGTFKK